MILQLGAVIIENIFIKGTFYIAETTLGLGYWGASKVYHYYYPIEINEDDDDYISIEINDQRKEITTLKKQLELIKQQNIKLCELLPHEKLC
jgi:hypothetical protein